MSRPQTSWRTLPKPQKQPIRAPKSKRTSPKLSKNQISEMTETYKMKVVQLHEQTPKHFLTLPNPENRPLGPKKSKITPKLSQNQRSELIETKKMKVVQLHEYPKTVCEPYPNPKSSLVGPQKNRKGPPKLSKNSNIRNDGNIQNESCSTT